MGDNSSAFPRTPATVEMTHGAGCLCGMSRRGFLEGAAEGGFGGAGVLRGAAVTEESGAAGFRAEPVTQTPASAHPVNLHHHMLPPAYIEKRLVQGVGEGSTEVSQWTPARTLEQMDKNGIATAVLSLSQPGINFDDIEGTRSMLRYCNEYGAEQVRNHPGRFGLSV